MFGNGDNEDDHIECDANTRDKIKLKLLDIQNVIDLNDIDCKFSEQNIKCDSITLREAQNRLDIYTNISKLSVYLMNDYEFFYNMRIQSAFKCPLYNTAMENLGYERKQSTWSLLSKPNQDTIIENIFKYCFYSYIVKFKKKKQIFYENQNKNQKDHLHNVGKRDQSPYRKREQYLYRKSEQSPFRKETVQQKTTYERNMYFEQRKPDFTREKLQDISTVQKTSSINNNNVVNIKTTEKQVEINVVADKWKCKICEMMNSHRNNICEACDSKGPHFEKWPCPSCTFINDPSAVNCNVCHYIK